MAKSDSFPDSFSAPIPDNMTMGGCMYGRVGAGWLGFFPIMDGNGSVSVSVSVSFVCLPR